MFLKAFEKLLNEAKIDDKLAASKLPEHDQKSIKEMNDHLTNKSKYVDFLIKHYKEEDIVDIINNFEKNVHKLPQKDILAYSLSDLKDLMNGEIKSKTDIKKEIMKDAEKAYEDDKVVIWMPKTYEASCKLGKGTKWCISSDSTNQHWHSYTSSRIKFYMAFSKDKKEGDDLYKVAIAVYPDGKKEYFDAADRKIKEPSFLK
jgi:hypothetical protein